MNDHLLQSRELAGRGAMMHNTEVHVSRSAGNQVSDRFSTVMYQIFTVAAAMLLIVTVAVLW
jgi:hypothetical protein